MDLGEYLIGWCMPLGYSTSCEPCEFGLYWHLYLGGERVNGGISRNETDARHDAASHAWMHHLVAP